MKGNTFTKLMLFLILVALLANITVRILTPREGVAQVPQVLIAQATERVASANERVAQAIEKLAASVQESNGRIAASIQKSAGK